MRQRILVAIDETLSVSTAIALILPNVTERNFRRSTDHEQSYLRHEPRAF